MLAELKHDNDLHKCRIANSNDNHLDGRCLDHAMIVAFIGAGRVDGPRKCTTLNTNSIDNKSTTDHSR